jgi:dipeptidyl aminopeptidase/acylaminoacyl peptidase
MATTEITIRAAPFYADGFKLDADIYLPPGYREGERRPALLAISGYTGLKPLHPARFARTFAPRGYVCLAFDYRGFGDSEGPRGRLVPQEQVEDTRAAISFLETVPEVDPERIGLIGWAVGGGIAIEEAADDPRVKAVAAFNSVANGGRTTRACHTDESWAELLGEIAEDRRERSRTGESRLVHPFHVLPLDKQTGGYVNEELYKASGYGADVSLEAADFLLRFQPEVHVDRIAPRPLLLIHGGENRLYSPDESRLLYSRAGEPKRLVILEGKGHTEWMFDDDPTFLECAGILEEFFAEALK